MSQPQRTPKATDIETRVAVVEKDVHRINTRLGSIEARQEELGNELRQGFNSLTEQLTARTTSTWRDLELGLRLIVYIGSIIGLTTTAIVYVSSNFMAADLLRLEHQIETSAKQREIDRLTARLDAARITFPGYVAENAQ